MKVLRHVSAKLLIFHYVFSYIAKVYDFKIRSGFEHNNYIVLSNKSV